MVFLLALHLPLNQYINIWLATQEKKVVPAATIQFFHYLSGVLHHILFKTFTEQEEDGENISFSALSLNFPLPPKPKGLAGGETIVILPAILRYFKAAS